MSYRLTLEEQETIIRIDRIEDYAYVYTSDTTMITKLNRLLQADDTEWELVEKDKISMRAKAPKSLISFRTKTTKRNMSEEQKREAAERMRALREEGKL